jgi:hypothetical protein
MSKSDDLRKEAKEAGKRGDKTKSLKEGSREHKRESPKRYAGQRGLAGRETET